MALSPYRPNEGIYARAVAGGALLLLTLFGCVRLYQQMDVEETTKMLGLPVPHAALWAGFVFVLLALVIAVFALGLRTGMRAIDARARGFVDLLVETELELQKVAWPTKDQLTNSTVVVLVCIVILGIFLVSVDCFVSRFMSLAGVLPR